MPKYNKTLLTEKARQFGFLTAPFEKSTRLIEILSFINEQGELQDSLALKGGTAINLTIFTLPRLSVDIDMDFTRNLTKEEIKLTREKFMSLLELYTTAEGYTKHRSSKRTHILDSSIFSYTNVSGNLDNIKVEINYSLRSHVLPIKISNLQTLDIFESFSIRTLHPIEIFASKIVALSSRAAARDLYDISNMISLNVFNEKDLSMLRKCVVFYTAITGEINTRDLNFKRITDITWHKVKRELLPMIRNTERFDLHAAHERVKMFMNEYMTLSNNELTFLKNFSKGHFEPELLFDDPEIISRIEKHPMALWRQQQIRDECGAR
jgi:predicted nucleotidyltransferase component of viral defense system